MESRHGPVVEACVILATVTRAGEATLDLLAALPPGRFPVCG